MIYKRTDGLTVRKWARNKGVCYNTIYSAIQRGLSIDEACEQSLKRKGRKDSHVHYFVGKWSLRHYCLKNNINYRTVCRWIRKGFTVGQALGKVKK